MKIAALSGAEESLNINIISKSLLCAVVVMEKSVIQPHFYVDYEKYILASVRDS